MFFSPSVSNQGKVYLMMMVQKKEQAIGVMVAERALSVYMKTQCILYTTVERALLTNLLFLYW
jgi:hypothetical protein